MSPAAEHEQATEEFATRLRRRSLDLEELTARLTRGPVDWRRPPPRAPKGRQILQSESAPKLRLQRHHCASYEQQRRCGKTRVPMNSM